MKYNVFLCLGVSFILLNNSMGALAPLPDSELKKIVNNSEYILIGVIKSIVEAKYNSGYIPTYNIKLKCKVVEFLKGSIPEEEIDIFGVITLEPPRVGTKGIIFLDKCQNESGFEMITNIYDVNNEFLSKIKKYIHEGSRLNEH